MLGEELGNTYNRERLKELVKVSGAEMVEDEEIIWGFVLALVKSFYL